MTVKLLTEQHLEFLCLTGGCTGSSKSTLVKMPYCWKSRATAQLYKNAICKVLAFCLVFVAEHAGLSAPEDRVFYGEVREHSGSGVECSIRDQGIVKNQIKQITARSIWASV